MAFSTIPEMFLDVCQKYGGKRTAIMFKESGDIEYQSITHEELKKRVECFALGLLNLGIRAGDRIGIVSENRLEWIISDLAIVSLGAMDVPLFPILTAKQEEYIFSNCQVAAIIVSNNFQLSKVLEFKDRMPHLRHVIVMNDEFNSDDLAVKSMKNVISRGEEIKPDNERSKIFDENARKVKEDDLLTLIYTSGTTGNPKGVMLTHKNVVSNIRGSVEFVKIMEEDILLSYLPLCHSFERTTGYYSFFSTGAIIALAESIETVASNISEIKPTIMTTVPKLMETVKKKIFLNIEKEKPSKQKVFHWAVKVGRKYALEKLDGKDPMLLRAQYAIADKLVFSKIRERVGGRLTRMCSGGAALPDDVATFFLAAGISAIQGYGLTETSPVVSCNRVDDNEVGTIGKPLPEVEVKIAEDGEILVRGPNVMKGYWNDPEATHQAIDEDGWLYTGDVGHFTPKGNIKITDRKKYLFVSSGGKNIAPQPIENILIQSKYIEHVLLIGDNREFCTALITPDFEQLKGLAEEFGIEYKLPSELISNEKIIRHIKKDLDYFQQDLAKFERVRKFKLLSQPFSVENGELSPKMSIKRHVVERKYSDLIDAMYD